MQPATRGHLSNGFALESGRGESVLFDMGNSPLDCTPERVQGRRLFISHQWHPCLTTSARRPSSTGSCLRQPRFCGGVCAQQPETVWIVGSGWEGSFRSKIRRVPVRSPTAF